MTHNFKEMIDRENTRAVKFDFRESLFGREDVLPMWVADMDFASVPELQDAIIERAKHNLYGYTTYDDQIINAIIKWLNDRHQFQVNSDLLSFSPGVIPSLHALIQTFTSEQDQVVIQTPVYPPFFSVVKAHHRELVENPLIKKNNRYEMDFEHLEKLFKNGAKAFILCSPHNPVGRVWTKDELTLLADLCVKYDVYLFSDEIHADLVLNGHNHTPVASINNEIAQKTFTLMAPSKTFNVAGLQASFVVSPNQDLKEKFDNQLMRQGFVTLNTFAFTVLDVVYHYGHEWLNGLISQLEENVELVEKKISESDTKVKMIKPDGTYLIWLDFTKTGLSHDDIKKKLSEEAKVGLNDGKTFGEQGEGYMRMNIASPPQIVEEAIIRITRAF